MGLLKFSATVACVVVFAVLAVNAFPSEDALLIVSTLKSLSARPKPWSQSQTVQLPVVSDACSSCAAHEAGSMRFASDLQAAQVCSGSQWLTLATERSTVGRSATTPAKSCLDILREGHSDGNGLYWLQHQGYATPYQAYCDMTTEGGGWTLFATKVSAAFPFNADSFQVDSAASINADHKGCIPLVTNWTKVLFRFSHDNASSRLVYNHLHGGANKDVLDAALECRVSKPNQIISTSGFVRHSPYENNGSRIPAKGFHTISSLYIYPLTHGISEDHGHSDKWLDMWKDVEDRGNNYNSLDSLNAWGTKCIAGTCYLNEPIWLMYR